LHKLNLLLEATMLLHSQFPLDSVLGTMLDHAISITDADRGLCTRARYLRSASHSVGTSQVGNSFCERNVRGDFSNFEALDVGQVAEIRLLVPSTKFSQEFNAGIVKKGSLNFSRCLGTVEREEMMAG
jgi:hypothetical protein